ncbi:MULTISPECIES: ATP-binding protein [unclassified Parabacteroides]|uniref:sensor histidine kinase n=1 Tax=unclassified Parabacteroides TaxID=2649774 RepID=UPI002473FC85|nr:MULTISPECIES: ATP-binding protein [unclassified Parabacteroides]
MRLKGLFWILTVLLLIILSITTYYVFYNSSFFMFACIEVLVVVTAIYLFIFYRSIIKPLQVIGDGMDLLKEQDFSSRLRQVGQPEADRIVDVFNKMMEQLKNERLHLREQNHFLDLLIQASPMGVIILDLDQQVLSINPAACKMFNIKSEEDISGKHLVEIDSLLATELLLIEQYTSQTIRLSDANIYKCTHSSFINRGFHQSFYLIESLTEEVFKAEKKAYEKVIRMIAHEVNNTTAGITSTLDTLDNTFKQLEGTEDICEVLQVAIERCYSMSRFITNFADVVRIPEPQLQEHDLNSLVIAGKRFMENVCLNRNIKINMELSEVSPIIQVDSLLFEQVLLNIIKNSAESIGHNGQIYIRTTADPVRLEIADTGKGIDKETETKLFSPFFSTKPNGQGLGLIFIREVLLKHGYTFSLRTYNDGLTRFVIML